MRLDTVNAESQFKCDKKKYKNRKEAKKDMKYYNQLPDFDLKNVYLCPICSHWHTTSMEKSDSRNYTQKLKGNL